MGSMRRVRAVLGIDKNDYSGLGPKGKAVHAGLSDHPDLFTDPLPKLNVFLGKILAFEQAQQLAGTRAKGSAALRNARAAELITALETALAYVQSVADENPEKAQAIIEAAAMQVAEVTGYKKPLLQAKQDVPGGRVHVLVNVGVLTADAVGKVLYHWQLTSDGGTTWSAMPPTPYGHMDFEGLAAGQSFGFRVAFSDLKGMHPFTQTFTYVVI